MYYTICVGDTSYFIAYSVYMYYTICVGDTSYFIAYSVYMYYTICAGDTSYFIAYTLCICSIPSYVLVIPLILLCTLVYVLYHICW